MMIRKWEVDRSTGEECRPHASEHHDLERATHVRWKADGRRGRLELLDIRLEANEVRDMYRILAGREAGE